MPSSGIYPEPVYPQHDHHCWITLGGVDWFIIGARFPHLLAESAVDGHGAILDLSKVDFDRYCKMTVLWDRMMY